MISTAKYDEPKLQLMGEVADYCPRPCKTCAGAKEFKSSATLRQSALVYIRRDSLRDDDERQERVW